MDINAWQALALGVVQGVTEPLPVSSSGHLYLLETWLGLTPSLTLEVLLHAGSLVAVVAYFWHDIWTCARGLLRRITTLQEFISRASVHLIISTVATVPVALLTEKYLHTQLTPQWVGLMLLLTAGLVFWSSKKQGTERAMTWQLALFVGLMQGLAAVPGLSRSGVTIAVLLLLGVHKQAAARYSFLLAIPTIAGALVFALADGGLQLEQTYIYVIGFAASVVASWWGIRWLMGWVGTRWAWFGGYCLLVGAALLVFA